MNKGLKQYATLPEVAGSLHEKDAGQKTTSGYQAKRQIGLSYI